MLIMHDNAGWPTSLLFSLFICLSCYTQICLQEKVKQSNPNPRVLLPMKRMEGIPGAKATKIVGFGL